MTVVASDLKEDPASLTLYVFAESGSPKPAPPTPACN